MPLDIKRLISSSTKFLSHCQYKTFSAGDVIIQVNQPPEALYYILYGNVNIFIPNHRDTGQRMDLASLRTGDFFGELGLFNDDNKRSAQVEATTPTALAELDYNTFELLVAEDKELLLTLSSHLANRLSATSRKLTEFIALERKSRQEAEDFEKERRQLLLDPLTDVSNRQAYLWHIEEEFVRWQRYRRPLSMAICDLDHFKKVNDAYGHLAGDYVLQLVATILKKRLRLSDFIARYGGEEFVILMPETSGDNAWLAMDSTRKLVEKCRFSYEDQPLDITFSCGVTEFGDGDESHEHPFKRADQALYQAKDKGRNSVILL